MILSRFTTLVIRCPGVTACAKAFDDATRRVALDRYPVPFGHLPIPFVTYEVDNDGIRRSKADYSYDFWPALKDRGAPGRLSWHYSGQMRWRTSAGEMAANEVSGTSPPRRGEPPSTPTANGSRPCSHGGR